MTFNKLQIFQNVLSLLPPGRLLDLGARRGNFSLAAARLGWTVTAVDARTVRFPNPLSLDNVLMANLIRSVRWVQADVLDYPIQPREFDLICILGLLHHMDVSDQQSLLQRCSTRLTLIDIRTAPVSIDQINGYEGELHREDRGPLPTASWDHPHAFRHTEASLLRLVRDSGYPRTMQMLPAHRRNYSFYLCLPHSQQSYQRVMPRNLRFPPRGDKTSEPRAVAL